MMTTVNKTLRVCFAPPRTPKELSERWPAEQYDEAIILTEEEDGTPAIFSTTGDVEHVAWLLQAALHAIFGGQFEMVEDGSERA